MRLLRAMVHLAITSLSRGRHRHRPRYRPRPPHRRVRVWLTTEPAGVSVLLDPKGTTYLMSNLRLDQLNNLSIEAVDANGNPVPAAIESATWSNSNDAAATLAATDATAVLTPVALGETTVSVTAVVGGQSFSASITVTVVPGAVAGIRIVENISPP